MSLSSDPAARSRQLANLRSGAAGAGAASAGPGNARALIHGGYARIARDRLDAKVREIFDAIAEDAPLRDAHGRLPAHDTMMVQLLAETWCRRENVTDYLTRRGFEDGDGQPRDAVLDLERRLRAEAAEYLDALGMSPRARARLGVDLVRMDDLAQQFAQRTSEEEAAADAA